MIRNLAGWIAFIILAVGPVGAAALRGQEPSLEIEASGEWVLTALPPILEREDVAPQLTRGLTTTFVFIVDRLGVPGGKEAGGARVEIRYELWDEIFHVTALGMGGRQARDELDSMEALVDWWGRVRLTVVSPAPNNPAEGGQARVRLDVVPFSQSEQVDTQRWLAQSVSSAELARSEGLSTSVDGSETRASGVFSVLIATSIRRRPVTSLRWTVVPTVSSPP